MNSDADASSRLEVRPGRAGDYLNRSELACLNATEMTRRMTDLAPMIAAHAAEAEKLRRPADAVWSALRRSGYFYQFVPREFGGLATDLDSFMDATLPIAEACASTGWTASFCAKHNWMLAHFPRETQVELWDGAYPYVVAPALGAPPGRAVRVSGGYRVDGCWKWGTGIMHADWVFAMAMLDEGGPPQVLQCLFPAHQAEIVDTWYVDGMCGTGSNDVRAHDVFVPEHRAISAMPLLAGRGAGSQTFAEPIYGTPMVSLNCVTGAVPALGAARGALGSFRSLLGRPAQPFGGVKRSERPATHVRLAQAELMIGTAETVIRDTGSRAVAAGRVQSPEQERLRIAVRARCAYAVGLCRQAVHQLAESAGSSVHWLDQPFQRAVRDLAVMASHVGYEPDSAYELHGRALLSLPANSMLF